MPEGIKYAKDFAVPTEFPEVLRNLTREVLRDQPKDINKYGEYMSVVEVGGVLVRGQTENHPCRERETSEGTRACLFLFTFRQMS